MILKKILFLSLLFYSFKSFSVIRTIDLSELTKENQNEVYKTFPIFLNNNFQLSDLDQLIKWLVTKDICESASVENKEADLNYILHVNQSKKIKEIEFIGINSFNESEIRNEFNIAEKTILDSDLILERAEHLRLFYKEQGFLNTEVHVEVASLNKTDYKVAIKVNENTRTRVDGIKILTKNQELLKKLTDLLDKKKNEPFTQNLVNNIKNELRSYFSENHYFKAELSEPTVLFSNDESRVYIGYKVDQPEEYSLDILGSNKYDSKEIKDAISLDTFISNNPSVAQEIAARIKAFYLGLGYAKIDVQVKEDDTTSRFKRKITINLNEGPRVKIDQIEFSGNISKSNSYYEKILLEQSSEIVSDGYYVKDDIDVGLKNLIIDRQNNGYLKAKVVSIRSIANKNQNSYSLSINFDEGPLTQIQKISFQGNNQFNDESLLEVLGLKQLESLRLNQLEDGIQKIKQFYHDNGFLEMSLINEKEDLVNYNEDNTLASLNFRIFEGPKVIVGSIVIEGNSITKDYVVLKEIEFKTGDVLTPALIEESVSRLQKLQLFSNVEIKTLEERTMLSRRTILVRVNDREPGVFNFGIGATNERSITLRGYGGVAYRNLNGQARSISLRADLNYNLTDIKYLERKLHFSYLEPYLLDSRLKGELSFVQSIYVSNFDVKSATESRQFTTSLRQDITSHLLFRWDLWNFVKYRDFSINDDPTYLGKTLDIGSLGPTFELDFRDHQFNPTKGTFSRLSLEYGSPELGSSEKIQFIRSFALVSHYWSIWKKLLWTNSVRGGYLQSLYPSNQGGYVPYSKKGFILGGQTTIRGFSPDEAFPNKYDGVTDSFNQTNYSTMYLFKSELSFPIWKDIGAAVFYDGGAVQIDNSSYTSKYRHSAGIAALYNTPVGAVSLQLGWKLNIIEGRNESPFYWHIGIGTF